MSSNSWRAIPVIALMVMFFVIQSSQALESSKSPDVRDSGVWGDYEFDLSSAGAGVLVVKFYVKDGILWARTSMASDPDPLNPVAGKVNAYTINNEREGLYEIEFLRDGKSFKRARLRNKSLGIDAIGERLEGTVHFPTLSERLASRDGLTEVRKDLNGVRVALYSGQGMDGHSTIALGRAFQWMGCDVELVTADTIKRNVLDTFNVFAFPGGETDPDPWRDLGLEGKSIIQKFIRDRGGYIGICFGALYACNNGDFWGAEMGVNELYLDLFPGMAHCGQMDLAPKGSWPLMTDLVTSDNAHPITNSVPKRIRAVTYPNGPFFQPFKGAIVITVATFQITGKPAMVAFEYGEGRVFLSGPHPEIEVDSDRDGSSRFDELSDEGSEWPLLLSVMKWITGRGEEGADLER